MTEKEIIVCLANKFSKKYIFENRNIYDLLKYKLSIEIVNGYGQFSFSQSNINCLTSKINNTHCC